MLKFDHIANKIAAITSEKPYLTIFFCVLLGLVIISGARWLDFDTNYRVFFIKGNPQLEAFEKLEKVYTKTDSLVFIIKPKSGDVFQTKVLTLIQELTQQSWQLPFSQRVDSITNFQHSYAEGDNLFITDLVESAAESYAPKALQKLKSIALAEPLLVNKLLSPDATTTGINVLINLPREDVYEVSDVTAAARKLAEEFQAKYPEVEIRLSGVVLLNNAFMESSMKDMQTIVPFMYLTLLIVMVILLRNIAATFATLIIILLSAATAMGFGGWMGFPLTPPSSVTPTIVLTLAIADSIHVIISMFKAMQRGLTKKQAIHDSLTINLQPVFLTSITTIIGFLSLNFSEAPPFWHLGNMTAFGIGAAFVYSIFVLPALLTLLPIKQPSHFEQNSNWLNLFADFVVHHRKPVLWIGVLIVFVLGAMISKIETNDQFVQYFDHDIQFRPDSEFMMKHLTGMYTLELSIPSKGPSEISDPEYLQNLEKFTIWLREQPEVAHVYSLSDIFKRLNKNLHADNPSWYRIPDNQELAAQYLLMYEFSLPFGLDLNDRVNIDKSATRLTITIKDSSSNQVRQFKKTIENWLQVNTPSYMQTKVTSPVVMFAYISKRNIESMIKGNLVSLLLISATILVALSSLKLGILSLVPNLSPIALGYGIWGLFIGQINMAVAIAASVSLGIIVDDTVHFLSKYQRARTNMALNSHDSVRYAFSTVGLALIITTIILVLGFLVLSSSSFQLNSYLGFLTALVIACALIADFFLLPALLMQIDNDAS